MGQGGIKEKQLPDDSGSDYINEKQSPDDSGKGYINEKQSDINDKQFPDVKVGRLISMTSNFQMSQ